MPTNFNIVAMLQKLLQNLKDQNWFTRNRKSILINTTEEKKITKGTIKE